MLNKKSIRLIRMTKRCTVFTVAIFIIIIIYLFPNNKEECKEDVKLPSYEIHIFYDGGFRNKKMDGEFRGWFHNDAKLKRTFKTAYYPMLGLYSSNDAMVIDMHMKQISAAGIGVVVVSWWPPNHEKAPPMSLILQYAQRYGLKVTIHLQNYKKRTIRDVKEQLKLFFTLYGEHPAIYKTKVIRKTKHLPIIYIHESNSIPFAHWNTLLGYNTNYSIRGSSSDAIYIGLLVKETDKLSIATSGFDGFYTFLAYRNYTFGSTWFNWPYIQDYARDEALVFIPTVAPGYDDRTVSSTFPYVDRKDGTYYDAAWVRAVVSRTKFVAINSFNGWLDGTQIEPAQPKESHSNKKSTSYDDYGSEGPHKYIAQTRNWAIEFSNRSEFRSA